MADLTITAANVTKTSGITVNAIAGATITAGQPVYIDTANSNVIKLATCEGTALQATVAGVSLHAALTGQPIAYLKGSNAESPGVLGLGSILTVGETYVLSATGLICPISDLATSDYVTLIGYATTTSALTLNCTAYAVEHA